MTRFSKFLRLVYYSRVEFCANTKAEMPSARVPKVMIVIPLLLLFMFIPPESNSLSGVIW